MAGNLSTRITIYADDKASSSFRKVGQEADSLVSKLLGMGPKVGDVLGGLGLGSLGAGLGAAGLGGLAKEATLAAAKYDMLGAAMDQAGKNAGYSAGQMQAAEMQLVRNGITLEKSRSLITQVTTANIDLAKSADLARTAQNLAVGENLNSSEAFERLLHGIVSGQKEVLSNMGLFVNFQQEYEKAARAMGKTAQALTEEEKLQVRVNATLKAGESLAGTYDAAMTKAGKQLSSFERHWSNLLTLTGEVGLDALAQGVFGVNESLEGVNERLLKMKESGELADIGKSIGNGFRTLTENIDTAALTMGVWVLASKAANTQAGVRLAELKKEHGLMAALKTEFSGLTAAVGQDTAAYIANTQAIVANNKARLGEIDKGIGAKQSVISELSAPEYAANLEAIKHRKTVEREVKILQGERIVIARQLGQAEKGLEEVAKRQNIALRGLSAAGSGLKNAGMGLVNFMGGPWVLGFTAATAAVYALANADSYAEREAKKHGVSLEGLNAQYERLSREAQKAAGATDNLTAAQQAAQSKAAQDRLNAAEAEAARIREMISRNSTVYSTDLFGSVTGEKQFDTKEISAYYAKYKDLVSEFQSGKMTAQDFALALGDMRRKLEDVSAGSWFSSTTGEAKDLLQTVSLVEGGVGKLLETLSRLGTMRLDLPSALPDSQLGFAEYNKKVAEARQQTEQLFAQTKAGRQAQLQAALDSAAANNSLLKTKETAAVLEQAQKNFADFHNKGASAAGRSASAFDALKSKVEELRGKLNEDAGETYLAKVNRELADMGRSAAKLSGTQRQQYEAMMAEYNTLANQYAGKEREKELEKTMQVRLDFEREYADLVGLTADAVSKSLQRQYEDYRKAGVDIVELEQWKADKIRRASREGFDGAAVYLHDFTLEATNQAKNTATALSGVFDGMGNAFEITTEGMKFNWQNMLNQMLNQAAKSMVINPILGGLSGGLSSLFGSVFGGGSAGFMSDAGMSSSGTGGGWLNFDSWTPSGFHDGGRIGGAPTFTRAMPADLWGDAPRFHQGGPILAPNERPIIAQVGEVMLSNKDVVDIVRAKNQGGGEGPIDLTVILKNESGQELQAKSQQTQWGGDMRSAVVSIVLDAVNRNYMGARDTLKA